MRINCGWCGGSFCTKWPKTKTGLHFCSHAHRGLFFNVVRRLVPKKYTARGKDVKEVSELARKVLKK